MFLDKIIDSTMKELNLSCDIKNNNFKKALAKEKLSFICEIKKASPSKGVIAEDFDYINIAKEYENAGADAMSILTEKNYFLGDIEYLKEVSKTVKTPLLRKDFILSEYQIYEAKVMGASAVLLISEILDTQKLKKFIKLAKDLGLYCLVECHSEKYLDNAINSGAEIIGINNRDLVTFNTTLDTTFKLIDKLPNEIITVSESGINTAEDIKLLNQSGVNAVLIGESLMRSENKLEKINELKKYL